MGLFNIPNNFSLVPLVVTLILNHHHFKSIFKSQKVLCSLWKGCLHVAFMASSFPIHSHTGAAHRQRVSVQQSGKRHPLLQARHQTRHPLPRPVCRSVVLVSLFNQDLITALCFSSNTKVWLIKYIFQVIL